MKSFPPLFSCGCMICYPGTDHAKNSCRNSVETSDPRKSSAETVDGLRQCGQKVRLILTLYQAVVARNLTTCVLANATEWSLLT